MSGPLSAPSYWFQKQLPHAVRANATQGWQLFAPTPPSTNRDVILDVACARSHAPTETHAINLSASLRQQASRWGRLEGRVPLFLSHISGELGSRNSEYKFVTQDALFSPQFAGLSNEDLQRLAEERAKARTQQLEPIMFRFVARYADLACARGSEPERIRARVLTRYFSWLTRENPNAEPIHEIYASEWLSLPSLTAVRG